MTTTDLSRRGFLIGAACVCTGVAAGCGSSQQYQSFIQATSDQRGTLVPLEQLSTTHTNLVYVAAHKSSVAIDYIAEANEPEDAWRALLLVCTHRGCKVAPNADGYLCPCHKSRFSADGDVLVGPARKPLTQLACVADEQAVHLTFPS